MGATIAGPVRVAAHLSSRSGFKAAALLLDGRQIASTRVARIIFSFDSLSFGNGSHTIEVAAHVKRHWLKASRVVTVANPAPAPPQRQPPDWSTVISDSFDDGLLPRHYYKYGDWPANSRLPTYYAQSHVYIANGSLNLLLRYEPDGPAGPRWYSGAVAIHGNNFGGGRNFRLTLRLRVVSRGVTSHCNLPLFWPEYQSPPPVGQGGNGEIDWLESDGELASFGTFLHYGTEREVVYHNYKGIDLTQWHIYRFQKRDYQLKVWIDDLVTPIWVYDGDPTTLPDVDRKLVFQQECRYNWPNGRPSCPSGTTGQEEIQIDWLTLERPS